MTTVRTDRLLLRPVARDDLDALAEVFAVPEVWWFPMQRGLERSETEEFVARQEQHWAAHGYGLWAVVEEERVLGFAGLSVPYFLPEVLPATEVGWRLHPDGWGRGLATEAATAALRWGFDDLGIRRVISITMPDNEASSAVMGRLGMELELETEHPARGVPLAVYATYGEQSVRS